jgi:septal ring factor EnvC (AmiA/AmiB activator)
MEALAIPFAALIISIATFYFTQRRSQVTEERTASKNVVELLQQQVEALQSRCKEIGSELEDVRRQLLLCNDARATLMDENIALMKKLVLGEN